MKPCLQPLLWRVLLVCCVLASACEWARAEKTESAVQQQIRALKNAGQPYGQDLWHAAEAEYRARLAATRLLMEHGSPPLDDGGATWQTATVINVNPYSDAGTTIGKGNEGSLPSCLTDGNDNAEDAWYSLTTTDSILLTLWTTCEDQGPPSYDTRLGVYSSSMVLLACNDDAPDCGGPYYQSYIEETALLPGTYYIIVDGYDGDAGPYVFNAEWVVGTPCVGSNNSNAEVITTLPFTDTGSTVDQCDDVEIACELPGDDTAPDYWYRLTLNTAVYLDVRTTCGVGFDSKLAIFDESYVQLYCNDDDPFCATHQSHIEDATLPAGIFYIVVDGWRDSEGAYELHVDTTHYQQGAAQDWLPDITIRESDLYDNDIRDNIIPGHIHLRLSNGTPNNGDGKFYLYGVFPPESDTTQAVRQRVYRSDGSFYDNDAGIFVYHEEHDHIHLADWCIYRLREVIDSTGVGPIVVEGEKTSFCIIDLAVFDTENRHFDPAGQFHNCASTIQGISAGWVDIYDKSLPGQYIDITGVAEGTYWLEAEADPDNHVLEENESNNINRVLVTIGTPPGLNPDPYEPNESRGQVDSRPAGGPNSPNLGPCNPTRVIPDLTIHSSGNDDYLKLYSCGPGVGSDYVRIDFENDNGDLDMELQNSTGQVLQVSDGVVDFEQVSLSGRAEGWYYVRIYGYDGATNPQYQLTVNPPANQPPVVDVLNPPPGNIDLIHGQDTYVCTWSHSDPENNEQWVTVWVNTEAVLNGNEILLPTSLFTDAETGFHIINSAYFPAGTYYIYCAITDGGTTTGDWSAGTVTWAPSQDVPHDHLQPFTFFLAQNYPNPFNPVTTVKFGITQAGWVDLRVYDILGRQVGVLMNSKQVPGNYAVSFDGSALPSGMYIYRLDSPDGVKTQKMVLMK